MTISIHEPTAAKLQKKSRQLISLCLKGKEPDFLKQYARVFDDYFREAFEASMVGPRMQINKNPYAIIALGGYGREEQCIHSDIDLLILFTKRVPAEAENLIREMIYPLWDIGIEVGYATRSLKESLALAAEDFEVLTPMLDARFICGMSHLYSELMNQLRIGFLKKRSKKIIDWLVAINKVRHNHYGDSAYLLEPHLKEGQGGLRDYHTMLWIARIEFDLRHPRDFEYFGCLSHDEFQSLRAALSFIWNVRNQLHHLCGRKYDRLHFENQVKLAGIFKFRKANGQQPVERFLARLHANMEFLKRQYFIFLYELGLEKTRKRRRKSHKFSTVEGLAVVDSRMLAFTEPEAILENPRVLMQIFEESARLKIPLSVEAKRLVKEFGYLMDKTLRSSAAVVESFERVLTTVTPSLDVLNEMLNTGLLQRFIPQYKKIVHRIQYDEYHLYPVEKHSLRTVSTVKSFGSKANTFEPLCKSIFRGVKNKRPLFWAALLHDIGKGDAQAEHTQRGATLAKRILSEKRVNPQDIETVKFLVGHHLLLIETATRRDIHDEETAIYCARLVKAIDRLKLLYLLTVADSMSTGPAAWNEWTSNLVREFFFKVANVLEKGDLATDEAIQTVKRKRQAIIRSARTKNEQLELDRLFDLMSPRYRLNIPAGHMLAHIELVKALGDAAFNWQIASSEEEQTRTVTICAKDRPGLISKIAGTLTLNNINILDVQAFTWKNNIALDVFCVTPPPDLHFESEKWERARTNLQAALSGQLDLAKALAKKRRSRKRPRKHISHKPNRVRIDNQSSSFFTIIEVFAYDYPGLLFQVTDALYRHHIDIWVAKIATKVDQVVDVFYVRDTQGEKVDSKKQIEALEKEILAQLDAF